MTVARATRPTLAFLVITLLSALLLSGCWGKQHTGDASLTPSNEQLLIEGARDALDRLTKERGVIPFTGSLASAKGVIIFPSLYKGSWIFGVEGGNGVMLARNDDGTWSPPSFVTMSDFSFGFQAGGQVTTAIMLLMEPKYLEDALSDDLTCSADISAAIGPVGHNAQLDRGTHTEGIIYAAYTQGLAFSMSLEGGTIVINKERNRNYYGKEVTPTEIIAGTVDNSGSMGLRERLAFYAAQHGPDTVTD